MQPLSEAVLKQQLSNAVDLHVYDEVDSTNILARNVAISGAPEGTVVLANKQTQGKGRRGRTFFSPQDCGLYMSIVLRPVADAPILYITTAAAVAGAESIEELAGIETSIKWVNDVYCNGKKVCGILTEGVFENRLQYAILGIGVNVIEPANGFPDDIAQRAGAVFGKKTALPDNVREKLAALIIRRFWAYYEDLPAKAFLEPYRKRDYLKNRVVEVLDVKGNVLDTVTASGITDEFELRITDKNDNTVVLSSGEVSLRL